jgi:UDP-hydrolysing UDP-N-acetyl-D-glucosamine 2-epimerase
MSDPHPWRARDGAVRRICVVVTARPSYSRVKTVLAAVGGHPDLELQLVVAASALLDRYGSVIDEMQNDGFEPDAQVFMVLEGENLASMAKTTGLGLMELATVFQNLQPDVVVTVADRYETIATAVASAYMNIPLVHLQGGEITGSIDEKVRHAITKLADLHLVASEQAAERVVRLGERPDTVVVTGCPSIDLAAQIAEAPDLDFDPFARYGGVGDTRSLDDGYVVVMQHPVTTEYELARHHITETLHACHDLGMPVLWFWPNVDAGSDGTSKGIRSYREEHAPAGMHFFKNMAPEDFLRLIVNSRCLIGNSSVGIREAAYLGVPVVNIGSRQQGRDRGPNVIDVDYDRDEIRRAIDKQITIGRYPSDYLYGDGAAGPRVAEAIATMPLTVEKRLAY